LLTAVIVIWVLIIIRFFAHMDNKSDEISIDNMPFDSVNTRFLERSYAISLNYRDPFLQHVSFNGSSKENRSKSINKPRPRAGEDKPNIEVRYFGSISGSSKIAIVQIDQQSFIMKENEERLNCKLVKVSESSIIVTIDGKKSEITK